MKRKDRPRFDIDALRELAGEKVFARGEAYYRGDQVQILAIEPVRVLAHVAGTEDYRTELTGRGKKFGGACSCPAFEDSGLCKHMVATALAANAAGDDAEAENTGTLSRMRDHLKKRGVDALVEMIMDLAERDPALFRKLDMAAAAVHADDKTLETRLRRSIDGATRTRGFIDYREAAGWAAEVNSVLDSVADLASGQRAVLALELAERLIDRIERAVGNMDDPTAIAARCSVGRATSTSPRPARRDPTPCRLPALSSPARWKTSTTLSAEPRRFMPTCSARRGLPNIAAWPARPGVSCNRAEGIGTARFRWRLSSAGARSRFFCRARRRCRHPDRAAYQGPVVAVAIPAAGGVLPRARPRGRSAAPRRGRPVVV